MINPKIIMIVFATTKFIVTLPQNHQMVINPTTTIETAQKLGLSVEEYQKIIEILGRTPNFTELSVFSVMWSEHCSYKNSIVWLKQLPKKGKRVLAGAGEENAGLMDIGDDLAVCFKIESHNHPSAVEPFQGAATGVGGIHRDIFTMGARPIATLNSLRFGNLHHPRTQFLMKGVVQGISHYGNCFGVPTVGGEIDFDDCYNANPLVNAMSVGIVKKGQTVSAIAKGIGNPVFIVGAATGKDGIHGATFASEDISEKSSEKLPSIQIGDPFYEKLLLEATLECIQTGAIIGMQDMGAAGIACSTSEMSAKGKVGMKLWLHKVPLRQKNMLPFEILLSESQERMLIVAEKGKEHLIQQVFEKWDLPCEQIGVVTDTGNLEYYFYDELVGVIPAEALVLGGGAPVYYREYQEPTYFHEIQKFSIQNIPIPKNLKDVTCFLLQLPSIASKKWVIRQYDSMVGAATVTTNCPADAAIVHIKETPKSIAMTTDCNARYVFSHPRKGCALAVAEAARNLVCSGALPLGVTNCLNFGNPYNPEVYFQFKEAILGMKEACEIFEVPVTGGNVSFYNQSPESAVYPTPTIGMVGIIEKPEYITSLAFQNENDLIYLLGKPVEDIACSAYLYHYHQVKYSPAPYVNLNEELQLQKIILQLIEKQLIQSAHDVSDGGLIVTLMESAFAGLKGFEVQNTTSLREDAFWFGEAGGRVVVSVSAEKEPDFLKILQQADFPYLLLGKVIPNSIILNGEKWGDWGEFKDLYDHAIERILNS
jgi:phosphoribosylformylglycinamidine synthase